jgi:hypothetical protein
MHIQFSEESWELRIASSSLDVEGEQRRSGLEHQRNIDKVREVHGKIKQVINAENK